MNVVQKTKVWLKLSRYSAITHLHGHVFLFFLPKLRPFPSNAFFLTVNVHKCFLFYIFILNMELCICNVHETTELRRRGTHTNMIEHCRRSVKECQRASNLSGPEPTSCLSIRLGIRVQNNDFHKSFTFLGILLGTWVERQENDREGKAWRMGPSMLPQDWFSTMSSTTPTPPDSLILLSTSPAVSHSIRFPTKAIKHECIINLWGVQRYGATFWSIKHKTNNNKRKHFGSSLQPST